MHIRRKIWVKVWFWKVPLVKVYAGILIFDNITRLAKLCNNIREDIYIHIPCLDSHPRKFIHEKLQNDQT